MKNNNALVAATASITVQRPSDVVFSFVCNPLNDPIWNRKVVSVEQLTPGPAAVGTKFRQAAAFVGGRIESEWTITEYQPNTLFRGESTRGLIPFHGSYTFATKFDCTTITKHVSFDLSGVLPPFFVLSVVEALLKKELESSFYLLKKIIERA